MNFPASEKICRITDPLHWTEEKMALFREACGEFARFHYENNPDIRAFYDSRQFNPASIENESDIARIPAVGVTAMKHFLLTTLPYETAVLKLTSSGTRGQKTQIGFDQKSLDRVQGMMDSYFEQEGWTSKTPTNYLVLNYDPDDAGDLGIAFTEKNQLRFAPINDVFFAIKKDKTTGQWVFQKEKALETLRRFAEDDKPVRIFAMPAFLFEFLLYLREIGAPRHSLNSESWVMTGGGWKAAEDKKVTRERVREMCLESFGIALANQRDAFGMAEHCAPYFECDHHRFHIAVYNRILIRDPISYAVLPAGETGLMELVTPFNAMMPNLAILTTDYGRLHADACPCGRKSPTFEILGRAGIQKHKGCAITASEVVKR